MNGTRPGRLRKILVMGIGNPGRQDDGLGPRFIERIRSMGSIGVTADSNYQLQIEDALALAEHDLVVFVDAAMNIEDAFSFQEVEPRAEIAFTTHALSPASVLALCRELYGKTPKAHLLGIRGVEFDIGETLSAEAERNLDAAFEFWLGYLEKSGAGPGEERRRRRPERKPRS